MWGGFITLYVQIQVSLDCKCPETGVGSSSLVSPLLSPVTSLFTQTPDLSTVWLILILPIGVARIGLWILLKNILNFGWITDTFGRWFNLFGNRNVNFLLSDSFLLYLGDFKKKSTHLNYWLTDLCCGWQLEFTENTETKKLKLKDMKGKRWPQGDTRRQTCP